MHFRRRSLRIWTSAALLALTTWIVSAAQLVSSRQHYLEAGRELALAMSNATAQRLASNLQILDQILQQAVQLIPKSGPLPPDVLDGIGPKVLTAGHVRALSFIDADGILRQVSHNLKDLLDTPVDVSDRPHVQYQRRHWSENRMAVSPPERGRLTERMNWYASRPVIDADGRFIGIVGMAIDPASLSAPLAAATPGQGDAAGIFSPDGLLFARNPDIVSLVGRSISASPVFQAYAERGGNGSLDEATSLGDQIARSVGFTQVPGYDLVVNVGISHDRLLAAWWNEVQIHGSIQAALTGCIFLLAWGLVRAERSSRHAAARLRTSEQEHIATLSAEVETRTGELQRSVAALQESEERFRLIADISPQPLVVTRRSDSVVIYINAQAAEAFLVRQEDAAGKVAPNFWDNPADRTRMVESLVNTGAVRNLEAVLKRANGQRFTALLSAAFGSFKGEAMVLVSVQDISERKRLEQELARSNAELERFSYAISHDLQEPLRMVASYLGLLERRYGEVLNGDGSEFINIAIDGAKRMSRMISDLLDYSRVSQQSRDIRNTDLNAVTAEALANLSTAIEAKGARVDVASLPTVAADPGQIMRVIQNLIGNALKYSQPDTQPTIRIAATAQGPFWSIEIADNGRGFEAGDLPRLFQPFQRLHNGHEVNGSGIGLALCRSIVEAHGGMIEAQSDGLGLGACFRFTLPAVHNNEKGAD